MELHCSQTNRPMIPTVLPFETPMELHCSQTAVTASDTGYMETPMELHCSQTGIETMTPEELFETPMELHCSQTAKLAERIHP